ncbi:MAG: Ig-like domain-containing protein, partial [Sulfuritalea sp.]|nr:Ig-like domain-containing protein [Sulfuritalea sp.]
APGSFTLAASATDSDGTIAKVEFYQGTILVGTATAAPYTVTWSNVPAGSYSLTAKATDNLGGTATTSPVAVIVNGLATVSLTSPAANAVIAAPATITVTANATDTDGSIAKVDFYQGSTLIGTATAAPYTFTWSNVPAGSYSLTATATDNLGGQMTSTPVAITVDAPPTVTLTSPIDGTVGIAPASFTLTANAADTDGTIAKVEFFNGTALLGTATSAPYTLNWDAVSPGNYSLTAKATDNLGVQTTSAAINVSVIANSPPTISLTSPTPNKSVRAPATIALAATASDPDNNLAKVEFFQNGTLIATVLSPPYVATWSNVPQGSYQITAVATDAVGAQTTSAPTPVTVTPAQASLYFIQADHLGTPRLVTDEANTIVWRNLPTTEPFGNTPPEEDPNATGTRFEMPLAFPGQYRDKESNLSYNFFRDYDPQGGRYWQSDPIGLQGGINTYSYVNGNPLSYADPSGLHPLIGLMLRLLSMGLTAVGAAEMPEAGLGGGPSMAAKAVRKAAAQCTGRGASAATDEAFHYTFGRAVTSIESQGLRAGSYATPNGALSPLQAQIDLALAPNRGLPESLLRVDLAGMRQAGYQIPEVTQVGRSFRMPGGGFEMQFPYPIPPEFIKVIRP